VISISRFSSFNVLIYVLFIFAGLKDLRKAAGLRSTLRKAKLSGTEGERGR
jgi:hypothetical protein